MDYLEVQPNEVGNWIRGFPIVLTLGIHAGKWRTNSGCSANAIAGIPESKATESSEAVPSPPGSTTMTFDESTLMRFRERSCVRCVPLNGRSTVFGGTSAFMMVYRVRLLFVVPDRLTLAGQ